MFWFSFESLAGWLPPSFPLLETRIITVAKYRLVLTGKGCDRLTALSFYRRQVRSGTEGVKQSRMPVV